MAQQPEHQTSIIDSIQSEVHTEASALLQWLVNNARLIFIAFILFIAVIIGHYFYTSQQEKQEKAEQQAFGAVLASTEGKARLEALETYLTTAPEKTRLTALVALAETAQELQDHAKAYSAWEEIGKVQPGLTVESALGMKQALAAQGKDKEALVLMENLLTKAPKAYSVLINTEIAALAEAQKDYARAVAAYKAMADASVDPQEERFWKQKQAELEAKQAQKS